MLATFWIGRGKRGNITKLVSNSYIFSQPYIKFKKKTVCTLILALFQQVMYIAMIISISPINLFDRINNSWHWEQISYLSQLEKYSYWIENIIWDLPDISFSRLTTTEVLRRKLTMVTGASKFKLISLFCNWDKTCALEFPTNWKWF